MPIKTSIIIVIIIFIIGSLFIAYIYFVPAPVRKLKTINSPVKTETTDNKEPKEKKELTPEEKRQQMENFLKSNVKSNTNLTTQERAERKQQMKDFLQNN